MPKTEVILTHNMVGLGAESDQVKVASGYARNYLIPQGLAIPLTAANKRRLEVLRQRRAEREALELNTMNELAKSVSKLVLLLKVKTGEDGRMFGAVTAGTIADELRQQFEVILDRKKIHLERPLRALGDHEVELRLHADVNASLNVRIESTTPPPAPAEAPSGTGKEPARGAGRETRGRGPFKPGAPAPGESGGKTEKPREERPGRTTARPRAEKPRETK
jgi:large subunit ribosomal protein L9